MSVFRHRQKGTTLQPEWQSRTPALKSLASPSKQVLGWRCPYGNPSSLNRIRVGGVQADLRRCAGIGLPVLPVAPLGSSTQALQALLEGAARSLLLQVGNPLLLLRYAGAGELRLLVPIRGRLGRRAVRALGEFLHGQSRQPSGQCV